MLYILLDRILMHGKLRMLNIHRSIYALLILSNYNALNKGYGGDGI